MASYQGVATSIPKLHKYMINILMRVTILALSLCKMMAFMQAYVATVMKVTHVTWKLSFFMLCNFFVSVNY